MRLVFDIEANGLIYDVSKVHCIAAIDVDTGQEYDWGPDQIEEGLKFLYEADVLIGHYILAYDIPVLWKVHKWAPKPGCRRIDTVTVSRLKHPNLAKDDKGRQDIPGKLKGSHSLEAWGLRLGEHKIKYEGGWENWSPEMHEYMKQDVRTNYRLLRYLKPEDYPPVPLQLELDAQYICGQVEQEGWPFNSQKAGDLYAKLVAKRDQLERDLVAKFGQWQEVDKVLIPKRDNKTRGYIKGVPVTKYKTVVFNPGSRQHIEKKLRELGWVPTVFTEGGAAKLDEDVLEKVDIPEAKEIIEYLLVQKRLSQLADGEQGWLRVVHRDGRIHGAYNPCGTLTRRASHYSPNVSQVPSVKSPYGAECRELFEVLPGWKLIGADMAGLELRCLAHYMAHYDKGEFGKIVVEGDVHWHMAQVYGFVPFGTAYNAENQTLKVIREKQSKTTTYAVIYGAGDAKVGRINSGSMRDGKRIKGNLLNNLPAYAKVVKAVQKGSAKGWIKSLDGGPLQIRGQHSALNTLLQGAGAILCKTWLVDFWDTMHANGYVHGWDKDFVIVGWIHDEIQVAVREHLVDTVGPILVNCAVHAGDRYGFAVPLDSSYVVGNNWKETH